MSSLSDGPASSEVVDSAPSSDLLHMLAQRIKALEESSAAQREFQSATIASQAAIIETLKESVKASEEAFEQAMKKSEKETATLQSDVQTLKKPRAPRNLVICIDGTSNQFGIKNTNVVELYHRLIRDENQLTFYNSGIGTYATPSWKSWRYWRLIIYNKIDLAIAWNFEGTIISAYRWLSENYEPGDKIFVFGFSRGAYQIRALAAMIDSVGLLRKGNLDQIPFAYELYAETKKTDPWTIVWIIGIVFGYVWTVIVVLFGWGLSAFYFVTQYPVVNVEEKPDIKEMCKHFKDTFSQPDVVVEFAGAWDTVSSVGFVRDKTLPGTTDGMNFVRYFRHALALHERRVKFLNENTRGGLGPTEAAVRVERDIWNRAGRPHTKEVWFAGSHGDIGGGAVSNLKMNMFGPSLRWMLYEAVEAGLRITSAPETEKDLQVHNSLTWLWVSLEYLPIPRLSYKDGDNVTFRPHCGQPRQIQPNQLIHSTALRSQTDWRAHLPEGVEWDETALRNCGMVEEDRYADARDLIARLSHLPPKDEDLRALEGLIYRDDGRLSLQNTVGAEATLMALLQFQVDHHIPMDMIESQIRWHDVASAALIVVDLDTAEKNQCELYSVDQLLPLVNRAEEKDDSRLDRLKGLLVPVIIKKIKEIFESPTDIPDDSAIRALKIVLETDHWKRLQDISETETVLINVLQRYSLETDPNGEGRQVMADAVLLLIQRENRERWNDKYYLDQEHELRPVLARARERNEPELLERFERRYAPAQVKLPFPHPSNVWCVAWMPDGARIVSGGADNAVRIWDVETGAIVGAPLTGHSNWVQSVAVSRDGSKIASGSFDMTIRVWNAQTGVEICCLEGHNNWVQSVAFSPDGANIASSSNDKTIRVWDIASGETVVGPIRGHEGSVRSVAYSPDGSRIVSGSSDESIRVWNATTGEEFWQTNTLTPIYSVAYSPDGKRIVAGGADEKLILDAETGTVVRRLGERGSLCVAFSPDGKKIASAAGTVVQLWDAETGAKLDVLRGHRETVSSVAFSPNSERIASASWDNTVRIWDATGAWRRAITDTTVESNGNNHAALPGL